MTIIGKIAIWDMVRSRPGVVPLGNMLMAWIDDNASSSTDGSLRAMFEDFDKNDFFDFSSFFSFFA